MIVADVTAVAVALLLHLGIRCERLVVVFFLNENSTNGHIYMYVNADQEKRTFVYVIFLGFLF